MKKNRFTELLPPPADLVDKNSELNRWKAENAHRPEWMTHDAGLRTIEEHFGFQLNTVPVDVLNAFQQLGIKSRQLTLEEKEVVATWFEQQRMVTPYLQDVIHGRPTFGRFISLFRIAIGKTHEAMFPANRHSTPRVQNFDDGTAVKGAGDQAR